MAACPRVEGARACCKIAWIAPAAPLFRLARGRGQASAASGTLIGRWRTSRPLPGLGRQAERRLDPAGKRIAASAP